MNEVYESMKAWNVAKNNVQALKEIFSKVNMFDFSAVDVEDSEFIHVYPGILNGELVFNTVASIHDKASAYKPDVLMPFVTTSAAQTAPFGDMNGEISKKEAERRVHYWNENASEWIERQVADRCMYQAFKIPAEDIRQGNVHEAFFALTRGTTSRTAFTADLIIVNRENDRSPIIAIYHDMVRPVPPFKPLEEKAEFGLLNYVEKQ